jgi:hypothetical protein
MALGRDDEAAALLRASDSRLSPAVRSYMEPVRMMLEGRPDLAAVQLNETHLHFPDPEARFVFARVAARLGKTDMAFSVLSAMAEQHAALPAPGRDPWLATLDREDRYSDLLAAVAERRARHRRRFEEITGGRAFG